MKLFQEALSSLSATKLNKEQKRVVQKEIQAAIDAIQIKDGLESVLGGLDDEDEDGGEEVEEQRLPGLPRNPKFPSLHQGVTIRYDSARGRHAVATEDIKCGTIILQEEPILSFLWGEHLLTHCSFCLAATSSPVPCYTCCLVVFCSSECRTRAWAQSHQYECKALEALTSEFQNIFPAYRAVAQKPLRYFLDNRSKFEKYDYHRCGGCYEYEYEDNSDSGELRYFWLIITLIPGETDSELDSEDENHEINGPYRSSDYENLFHLITHSEKVAEADTIAFSTSACLLLYYLKISNYFGSSGSRDRGELSDSELLIARLLHHFLQVLQFNSSEVSQAGSWSPEKGLKMEGIGCSVGNTLALFNHSCNPNTVLARRGATALLLTTSNIRKGQEVTTTYGPVFHEKMIKGRQDLLKERFKFDCTCPACEGKWPVYEFLTKSKVRKGVEAGAVNRLKKMYATISKLTSADLTVGHYDRVQVMWANYCSELELTLESPNKGYVKLASRLRDCLWLRWGSRGPRCEAPKWRDHKINQRRSSSNMNIPQMVKDQGGEE